MELDLDTVEERRAEVVLDLVSADWAGQGPGCLGVNAYSLGGDPAPEVFSPGSWRSQS